HHGRRAHFGAPGNGPDASHGKVAVSACRADPAVPANAGECPRPREERLGRHCVLPAGFARARCLFERVRTHPGPLLRHGTACAYHGGSGRPSPRSGDRPASGPRPPHGGRRSLTPPSTPSALAARPLAVLSCALLLGVFLGSGVAFFPASIAGLVVLVLGGVLWLSAVGRCSPGFGCLVFGVFLAGLASAALAQLKAEPPAWIRTGGGRASTRSEASRCIMREPGSGFWRAGSPDRWPRWINGAPGFVTRPSGPWKIRLRGSIWLW